MAKISDNDILNILTEDWSKDSRNGLPYSGKAVRTALQTALSELKKEKIGAIYFDTTAMKLLSFADAETKARYLKTEDVSLIMESQDVNLSGVVRRVVVNEKDYLSSIGFSTNNDSADLVMNYKVEEKGIQDTEWSIVHEDARYSIYIDRGLTGEYETFVENVFVRDGEPFSVDVLKGLISGDNRIRIVVTSISSSMTGECFITAHLTTMYLSPSNFSWYTPFIEGKAYSLGGMHIGGILEKVLKVKVSNGNTYSKTYTEEIGTNIYTTNDYYFNKLEFPETGTGIYNVEIWLDANGLESDHLMYNIMCVSAEEETTAKLCCLSTIPKVINNFEDNTLFEYSLYNGGLTTADPSIQLAAIVNTNTYLITEETLSGVETGVAITYKSNLELETADANVKLKAIFDYGVVQEVIYDVDNSKSYPATSGAIFYLNAANRNNSQSNRHSIINESNQESVTAEWQNISWVDGTDGWTIDDTGRKCLVLPATTKCSIDYHPLLNIGNGKTIEFTYKVANAANLDDVVISICSNLNDSKFRGIIIKPNDIVVHSRDKNTADSDQSYQPADEEVVNVQISIISKYKTNYGNICKIYVNGVIKRAFEFSSSDSFVTDAGIIMGCDTADLYVYSIRVYNRAFDKTDAMKNYIASLADSKSKAAAQMEIDSIVDDSYDIDYNKTRNVANVAVVEMLNNAELPHYGLNKSYSANCNLDIQWHDHPEYNAAISNVQISGQGTTSMNYWDWNLRFRLDKGTPTIIYADGKVSEDARLKFDGDNHTPIQRITAKINYASSMQSHKMGATGAFNDLHHELDLDNETGGRVAVYQEPFYFFQKINVEETDTYVYKFIGLFTMGPDKGDKATFGYDNSTYKSTLIHMEGTDHQVKSVGMDYPWSELKYVASEESLCVVKGGNKFDKAWEIGASGSAKSETDIQTLLNAEFKPAYDVAYNNSTLLLGVDLTLDQINADVNTFRLLRDAEGHAYQRFEVYTNGIYDLYYFNVRENKYIPTGVNLLTDLSISSDSIVSMTSEERNEFFKNQRRERFKTDVGNYWHLDDALFHYVFMELMGATDNFKKNSYPYKFGLLADGSRWRWRQDDLDTIADIDNQGKPEKGYSIEVKDFADDTKTAYAFKGEDSVFWTLIHECYQDEIKAMGQRVFTAMESLSKYGSTTVDRLMGFFRTYFWDKAQYYFTKSAYNVDAEYKYEEAWPSYNKGTYSVDVHPLNQSLGDHLEAEKNWFYRRILYMMSKWQYGPFAQYTDTSLGRITFRTQLAQAFNLTPYMDLYPVILTGQGVINGGSRTKSGESVQIDNVGGSNTNVYIAGADILEGIGDLSTLAVDASSTPLLSISSKRLESLKLGDEDSSKVTSNVAMLNVGKCESLTSVDARNLVTLTGALDLSECPRLKEVFLNGTNVGELKLANGSKVEAIKLPESITALTFRNLTKLNTLEYDGLANIEFLRIENCPLISPFELLKEIYNTENNRLSDIRIVGFNTSATAKDIELLAFIARGIDKDGNERIYKGINTEGIALDITPVVEGKLSVNGNLYKSDYDEVVAAFPNMNMTFYGNFYVKFNDPVFEEYMANTYGDGVGTMQSEVNSVTTLGSANMNNVEMTVFSDLDKFSNLTTLYRLFDSHPTLEEFICPNVDVSKITDFTKLLYNSKVEKVDVSGWKFGTGQDIDISWAFCVSTTTKPLDELDLSTWDLSNAGTLTLGSAGGNGSYFTKVLKFPKSNFKLKCSNLLPASMSDKIEAIDNFNHITFVGFPDSRGSLYGGQSFSKITELDFSYWSAGNDGTNFPPLQNGYNNNLANLTSLNVEGWKLSNISTFSHQLAGMPLLNHLDLSTWDWSGARVYDFSYMFYNDSALTGDIDISKFDWSYAQSTRGMFENCKHLSSVCSDWSKVDLTKATTLEYMFRDCNELNGDIDLSNRSFPNLTTIEWMFKNAYCLNSVDFSGVNMPKLTKMQKAFENLASCTAISFKNASLPELTTMSQAFYASTGVLDLSGIYIPKLTVFNDSTSANGKFSEVLFKGCRGNGNRINFRCAFESNTNITKVDFSECSDIKIGNGNAMFRNTTRLSEIPGIADLIDEGTDMTEMFSSTNALTTISLNKIGGSASKTFFKCNALTDLHIEDVSAVTSFSQAFESDYLLRNITGFTGLKVSLPLGNCSNLSRESILNLFEKAETVNTTQVLTLNKTAVQAALLTDDEIKVLTDKGWTLTQV